VDLSGCGWGPLMECTFRPLLFLYRRPFSCLRRTWWDGVEEDVWIGSVKRKLADLGSRGRMVVKPACVCVCVCVCVCISDWCHRLYTLICLVIASLLFSF